MCHKHPKDFFSLNRKVRAYLELISKRPKDLDMPMLFHCHLCDKPTANRDGLCNDCKKKGVIDDVNRNNIVDVSIISNRVTNVTERS